MNATSVLINEVILIWRPRAFSYMLFAPIWMLFTFSMTPFQNGNYYEFSNCLYIYMFWYFKSLSVQQIDYMIFYVLSNDISIIFVVIGEMF